MKDKEIIKIIREALQYDQERLADDSDFADAHDRLKVCLEVVHDAIRSKDGYVTPVSQITLYHVRSV